jgi:hypothetical protein
MRIDRRGLDGLGIEIPLEAGDCLRFAAAELAGYLRAMGAGGVSVRERAGLARSTLRLGAGPPAEPPAGADAFRISPGDRGVTLAGNGERAVLHATYRLLEQFGCVWSFHGRDHETVPKLAAEGVCVVETRNVPAWDVRAYVTDIHTYHYHEPEVQAQRLAADLAFTDWMGKSGANAFLFIRHPFDTEVTIPSLLPEFRCRGIVPEYGGHVLPLLLPRERFGERPEWFPADRQGRRHDLGNLCSSSAEALEFSALAAVEYARRHPEMGVLHIWGADLWDGGWCHCSACAGVSVQDQSLRVCNAVAEALETAGHDLAVCYLAYHDTIEPNLRGTPHPSVWAEFAPRERCYGHALDDPTCAVNPRYRAAFDRHVETFDGRVRIFEYYGDAILFCGIAAPLTTVIEADLDYYRRGGARQVSFLQFGAYSLWAHPLNFLAFAAATARPAGARLDLAASGWGGYPSSYWRDLERTMAAVVTYGDVRRPPRARADEIRPRLEGALARLRAWRPKLGSDPLAQASLLKYTCAVLEGVLLHLAGLPTAEDEAEACYRRAIEIVAAVDDRLAGVWGRRDLPVIHSFHSATTRGA